MIRAPLHCASRLPACAWSLVAMLALALPSADAQPTVLPWAKSGGGPAGKPARRAASARELLVNVDASQWENFRDGRPLHVDEEETLIRILFRLPTIGEYDSYRLARPVDDWPALQDDPASHRGEMRLVRGRVERVTRVALLPEVVRRFQFEHYFQVILRPADATYTVLVCARSVPEEWSVGQAIDERASVAGVFLKAGDPASDEARAIFAADRLAWFPDRPDPQRGINDDLVLLSNLGMDISRLADIRKRDHQPLEVADTECFYQMLAAAREADPEDLVARAANFELAPFIQQPQRQHGRLVKVAGRAKRITKIVLSDPELKERFHIDHYYEVDLMVPLGDTEVRLPRNAQDKDAPVLTLGYPVICCVLEVPSRLESVADQADLNEDMTLVGFNFRLWSYQSQFLDERARQEAKPGDDPAKTPRRRQPSPLFLAPRAEFSPAPPTDQGQIGTYLVGALLVALAVVGIITFWTRRSDADARRKLRALHHEKTP